MIISTLFRKRKFTTVFLFTLFMLALKSQPVIHYPMTQTPVVGTNMIQDFATAVTSQWGSFKSSTLPTVISGPRSFLSNAWSFNGSTYLGVNSNNTISSIGDISKTAGMSVGFWIKYPTYPINTGRICTIGTGTYNTTFYVEGQVLKGTYILSFVFGDNSNIPSFAIHSENGGTLDFTQWHHFIVTFDFRRTTNNVIIYEDGVSKTFSDLSGSYPISNSPQTSFNCKPTSTSTNFSVGAFTTGQHILTAMLSDLRVYTNALSPSEIAQLYNSGTISNYSPVVMASSDNKSVIWPLKTIKLQAKVADDGPSGSTSVSWSQLSGPATVSFDNPAILNPTITFPSVGTYSFRCTASDGTLTDYDDISIVVATNQPPSVSASVSKDTIILSNYPRILNLSGWATDDGFPKHPGVVKTNWSLISGPAYVSFGNSSLINTTVTIPPTIGTYQLRLTANDSLLSSVSDVVVKVIKNESPIVSAWSNQPILHWPANTFVLNGSVTDDGRPTTPGFLSYQWTKTKGPGSVTFSSSTTANTSVICSLPGDYRFKLTVTDGELYGSKEFDATIWDKYSGCNPPQMVRRLSNTPPPYEHPRVLFTKADRADLLNRITNDSIVHDAVFGTTGLNVAIASSIDNSASPSGILYASLSVGDESVSSQSAVTNASFYSSLLNACYVAWVFQDNPTRLQQLATAVATAAKIQYQWWAVGSSVHEDFGLCYDLMYDWMTPSQRDVSRQFITDMARNQHTASWGYADFSKQNWMMEYLSVLLLDFAIENETGYDAQTTKDNIVLAKNYCNRWALMENGFNGEGMGYIAFGMHNGAPSIYAIARRDSNMFVNTNLSKSLNQAFYELAPWGDGKMFDHHDGSGWSGSAPGTFYYVMKYMYPEDKNVDLVFRNVLKTKTTSSIPLYRAIFGVQPLSGNTSFSLAAPASGMGLGIFEPKRGAGVARSDWSNNAVQLDFECRFDMFGTGHMHSDRNNFTLLANGRNWIADYGAAQHNDAHSTILIDSIGQSGCLHDYTVSPFKMHWPSVCGKFVDYRNEQLFTLFAGDAKFAYDHSNAGNDPNGNNPDQFKLGVPSTTRWKDMWYGAPNVLVGGDTLLNNYIRVDASPYNPVQKAFRTAMLVRGSKPYVLIVDDVKKDELTHTYDWSVNTNASISSSSISDFDMAMLSANNTDAILYRTRDIANPLQPRLLVRVIDAKGTAVPIQMLDYVDAAKVHLNRIVVSRSNIISPDFKILLYPHLKGDSLPTTTYDGTTLTVLMKDGQKDNITFTANLDGRTRIQPTRVSGQYTGTNDALLAPTNLTAISGDDKIALKWDFVISSTSYNVKRATISGGPYIYIAKNIPVPNYIDTTGINNGTTYYYVVSATNSGGESLNSIQVGALPLPILTTHTTVSAIPGVSQVKLNWKSLIGATTYNIKRSTLSGGPYTTVANGNFLTYTDNTVSNGTNYYYVVTGVNIAGEGSLSNEIRTLPLASGSASPQPYTTIINVPGIVEAENFDKGGEGVAYHDSELTNTTGKYRLTEGVDIDTSSAGGYCLTSLKTGEWLEYTINSTIAMTYTLNIIASSVLNTGKIHIELDGVNLTGSIAITSTGTLQYYNTWYSDMYLSVGSHQIRLFIESGDFNLDKIVFLPATANPIYNIIAKHSSKAIYVKGSSIVNNAQITQITSNPASTSQQWIFFQSKNKNIIKNVKSAKTATISGGLVTDYSNIIQTDFYDNQTQYWDLIDLGDGYNVFNCWGNNNVVAYPQSKTWYVANAALTDDAAVTSKVRQPSDAVKFYLTSVQYAQLPYNGKAVQIPCTFEAEDFDLGGEGLGYHNTVYNNFSATYRVHEAVDIAPNGSNFGFYVNSNQAGQWLEYTIYAPSTCDYPVSVKVASTVSTGKFHINIDGVTKVATKTVNNTGGNNYWINVTDTLRELTAGYHKLRLVVDNSGFSIDNICLSLPIPQDPINLTAIAGDGKVTLNWAAVKGATAYNLYRRNSIVDINTLVTSNLSTTSYVNMGLTNGTTYYYSVSALNQWGESKNSIQVSVTPDSTTLIDKVISDASLYIYPNPASDVIHIQNADNSLISIHDGLGKVLNQTLAKGMITSIPVSSLQNGFYFLRLTKNQKVFTKKFLINR